MSIQQQPDAVSTPSAPASSAGALTVEMVAKQQEFFETRVKHPAMERLLEELWPMLMPYSESNILVLTGATGVGKSTLTRSLLTKLVQDFAKIMESDPAAIPLISVEAYANGDVRHGFKGLYKGLIRALQSPDSARTTTEVKDGKVKVKTLGRDTIESLRDTVEAELRNRKTRVVVIDEAAHMTRFGKKAAVMHALKSIANTTGAKIVLVGSFDLLDLVLEEDAGQVVRRSCLFNMERYRPDSARDRKDFRDVVVKLQNKWPCDETPNFVAISDYLLEVSLGCVGLLKTLMLDASAMQLRNHGKWEPQFLVKAAKACKLLAVIRKEVELGEKKARDALVGDSPWNQETFAKLVQLMGETTHA